MEFEGIVEGLEVCQKALMLWAGCSAGGLQTGQSQSGGRSSLVGLKELPKCSKFCFSSGAEGEGRATSISEDNGHNK